MRQSPLDKIEINTDERENKSTDSDCDKDVKQATSKPLIPKISWPIAHEEYSAAAMREETDDNEQTLSWMSPLDKKSRADQSSLAKNKTKAKQSERCTLCKKTFKNYVSLQVHLMNHEFMQGALIGHSKPESLKK